MISRVFNSCNPSCSVFFLVVKWTHTPSRARPHITAHAEYAPDEKHTSASSNDTPTISGTVRGMSLFGRGHTRVASDQLVPNSVSSSISVPTSVLPHLVHSPTVTRLSMGSSGPP